MESLQEKLLNFYPSFLTRLPDSVQYRFVKTIRNSLIPIYQTLKVLSLQEDLDRPIQIYKEQYKPYVYSLHFHILLDNIECVEIYRENLEDGDELLEAFHFNVDEAKSDFYHVLRDIHTDNNEIIPNTRYYIYVRTYDEYEFYKGYPENDYPVGDYLKINKTINFDGTYSLEFKTQGLNNIYKISIGTKTENNTDIFKEEFEDLQSNYTKTFKKILKEDLIQNIYTFKVYTCDKILNNDKINSKVYILSLSQNKIEEDIFNHDKALDIIGNRLDFPRSKFNIYTGDATNYDNNADSEYIKFYKDTEPAYNNRLTEDDYHYANRMKFYCENIQAHIDNLSIGENVLEFTPHRQNTTISKALELPQLEVYKYWGIIPEIVNRDEFLIKQNKDTMRGILCGTGDEGLKVPTKINLKKTPHLIIGVESKLTALVTDAETGEPINKGNVLFKIKQGNNIITKKVKIENYQATIEYTPESYGNLNIELTYQGTGKYKRSNKKYTDKDAIFVHKVPVKIFASDVRCIREKPFTIQAHIISTRNSDENITGTIYFKIQDIKTTQEYNIGYTPENYLNDYNNEVKHLEPQLLVNLIPVGDYTITAYYSGSEIFEANQINFKLKITEEAGDTYIHSIFIPPNHISCKLYNSDGVSLNDKEVKLRYKHVTIDTIKTHKTKYTPFSKSAIIPENLGDLELSFYGDDEYKETNYKIPSFEPLTLENTIILINNEINCLKDKNNIITAILYSKQGQLLKNQSLKWIINEETYTSITDNNGVATLNYTPNTIGTYTLNIQYEGESLKYYPTETNTQINVIDSINTILKTNTTTVYVDGEMIITLEDENGEKIPNQTILLKNTTLTDSNYGEIFKQATTNNQGQAIIHFNMSPKENKQIQIIYEGDSQGYYKESILNIDNFTIRKHPLNINSTPTRNSQLIYSDSNSIKTVVRDGDTLETLENIPVYWHFTRTTTGANERIGPVLTNAQGIAECKIAYAPGQYTYGVIIPEYEKYNGKDTYTQEEYRIPFTITKNNTPIEEIQTFKINSTPETIKQGEPYTVTVNLTGQTNITPTGKVVIYTGENNNGTLTGIQGEIELKDIGGGNAYGSTQLQSQSNTTPNTYTIKAYYTGDSIFKPTDSKNYTNGTSNITVETNNTTTNTKKQIKKFTINIEETTIYAGDEYTVNITLEGENTPPTPTPTKQQHK